MFGSENAYVVIAITVAIIGISLIALVVVRLLKKLFRSKYSPFKFVNRLLDVEVPIRITTPLSPDAAERNLRDRVSRFGIPLVMSRRLVGVATARDIRVRLHRPFADNSFGPVFYGSIASEHGLTVVEGKYRLHSFVRYFMMFWFGGIIVWSTVGIPTGIVQLMAGDLEGAILVISPFMMFGFGTAIVKFGAYAGDKDRKLIANELAQAIGGTITWPEIALRTE